jgi:hypothetical protein
MAAKSKFIRRLRSAYLALDKTGTAANTTLSANAAAGATSFTITSATNLAIGDAIRVGEGETCELVHVSNLVTTTVTPSKPLRHAHLSGEAVVEQTVFDLGDVEQQGATVSVNGETSDLLVATKRLAFAILNGYVDLRAEFSLPTLSLYSFAIATGMPLSSVSGSKTTAAPLHLTTDGNEFGSVQNATLVLSAVLMDNSIVTHEIFGGDADYSAVSVPFVRGQPATLACRFTASAGGRAYTGAPPYTVDTSIRPSKGDVFSGLSEVGFFGDLGGGASTTVATATAAAGQSVVELASTTGIGQGDVLRFGSGDTVEYHAVESIASPNVTLRTKLFRDQVVGTAVVEQERLTFGGVAPGGVTLTTGGSVESLRVATSPLTVGTRPGNALVTLALSLQDVTLANVARALGIPQSDISGGLMNIGENVNTSPLESLYLRGINQSGDTVEVQAWGCSQQIAYALRKASTGEMAFPITVRPGSALQMQQAA